MEAMQRIWHSKSEEMLTSLCRMEPLRCCQLIGLLHCYPVSFQEDELAKHQSTALCLGHAGPHLPTMPPGFAHCRRSCSRNGGRGRGVRHAGLAPVHRRLDELQVHAVLVLQKDAATTTLKPEHGEHSIIVNQHTSCSILAMRLRMELTQTLALT